MREIKELITKANEQLRRIREYITEHEDMFNSMDLKLHDANFYEYKDMEKDGYIRVSGRGKGKKITLK